MAESYEILFIFLRKHQTVSMAGSASSVGGFPLLHVPVNTCYYLLVCLFLATLAGVKGCPTVVFICISLMTNGAEHLFMCLRPFVYLVWINVYSSLVPILIVFVVELREFFIYSGVKPL